MNAANAKPNGTKTFQTTSNLRHVRLAIGTR